MIAAIPAWSVADCFSPLERAVLAYTDCLVLEGGRVPDEVFEALRAELNDTEILEFTYITCTYDMHATMSRALRLEYDDVDDPIVEVAAPEGASTDVMAAFTSMVSSGIFEKYPRLKCSVLEAGGNWISAWLDRMDHKYEVMSSVVPMSMKPRSRTL